MLKSLRKPQLLGLSSDLFRRLGHWVFGRLTHSVESSTGLINSSLIESNHRLNGLCKSGQVDQARKLFDKMPQRDEFSWNTVISGYSRLGRFDEALEAFGEAPNRSCITWNSVISGYCHHGRVDEAFGLLCDMQYDGFRPNHFTLGSVLGMCSKLKLLERGEQVHCFAIRTCLDMNIYVVTGLVDMYAKCNSLPEAEDLFRCAAAHERNTVLWTALLTGYTYNGQADKAMMCFRGMLAEGILPNQFSFPSILSACAEASALWFGKQVHGCIAKSHLVDNTYVEGSLLDMYAKCSDLSSAEIVFEDVKEDNVVSWNSMINACNRKGFEVKALSLFKRMHARKVEIDEFTYPCVLKCCASDPDTRNAKSIHCLVIKSGFENYNLISNTLIHTYSKQGSMESAVAIFRQILNKDVISWTSIFTGFVQNNLQTDALNLLCDLRQAGVLLDKTLSSTILSACAEFTRLELGKYLHALSIKSGLGSSLLVNNSLVALYAQCGHLDDARSVFNLMSAHDLITWTSLLVGYAQNGRAEQSIRIYEKMVETGIKPDYVTFIGLLFACSHDGRVREGQYFFKAMDEIYGIKPGPEHYACMIDLLARSGKFTQVNDVLNQMDIEPNASVWKAVLSACRMHGNVELAEKAAMSLFNLEPLNSVPYILLANIYSSKGRWSDSAKLRKLMKSRGITKEAGCSWVEMYGEVHTFVSEDRSHPRMTEIYSTLNKIITLIKRAGYVPDLKFALHDVDEKDKELSVAYHSEKLAVAFALLVLPPKAPVLIFKNIRVCGDCHSAMKLISEAFSRHIILRDSNCFHHFERGLCSCKDYW